MYLAKKDTPEIKAMGRAFARVSPARGGRFFAWVLDGASVDERAAVTSEVPAPVLTVLGGVFGRSYRKNVSLRLVRVTMIRLVHRIAWAAETS